MGDIVIKNEFNLLGGITPILYGTNKYHRLLGDDNIGTDGENLTIVVLSCERAQSTIRMMESIKENIPNFKGEYLIADNGSTSETINQLKDAMKKMPYKTKIIEFGENFGVAKGRNKAIQYVDTEWFMSLDNDILFSCNILPEIKNTISQLGCNFVNLPLLNNTGDAVFSIGGHIYIEQIKNGIHIGCGGAFEQVKCSKNQLVERSLSTFLFGGASVIKKSTFEECGKFDEGMFVGFEDIDFSITIFKKGYKIGTVGVLGLIHDHKKPENENDLEYERKRFSNVKLLNSAMYFEKKHKFKIWNEATEQWLKQREKELGIISNDAEKKKDIIKKKVSIIVDDMDSEEDKKAKVIEEKIKNRCDTRIIYFSEIDYNIINLIYSIQNTDKVYIISKNVVNQDNIKKINEYTEKYQLDKEVFISRYITNKEFVMTEKNDVDFWEKTIKIIKEEELIKFLEK